MSLLSAGGKLISASWDGSITRGTCGVAGGRCEGMLEGHTDWVMSPGGERRTCGERDQGPSDGTVHVWGMEWESSKWRCERTLDGQRSRVHCVAGWESGVAGGCENEDIRVWGIEAWELERTLQGHENDVCALVTSGGRLIISSSDRTVRV